MHLFRSKEDRADEIGEGLSPAQVALDQAAHIMDAIATGKKGSIGCSAYHMSVVSMRYTCGEVLCTYIGLYMAIIYIQLIYT